MSMLKRICPVIALACSLSHFGLCVKQLWARPPVLAHSLAGRALEEGQGQSSVIWSAHDGQLLILDLRKSSLRTVNVLSGQVVASVVLEGSAGQASRLLGEAEGSVIVEHLDGTISAYSSNDGVRKYSLPLNSNGTGQDLAISERTASKVAILDKRASSVTVFSSIDGTECATHFLPDARLLRSLAFAPDGRLALLLANAPANELELVHWDVRQPDRSSTARLPSFFDSLEQTQIDRTGRFVMLNGIRSGRRKLVLWDAQNSMVFASHEFPIVGKWRCDAADDNGRIIGVRNGTTPAIIDCLRGQESVLALNVGQIRGIELDRSKRWIAIVGTDAVRIFDLVKGAESSLTMGRGAVRRVQLIDKGRLILTVSANGAALWNPRDGTNIASSSKLKNCIVEGNGKNIIGVFVDDTCGVIDLSHLRARSRFSVADELLNEEVSTAIGPQLLQRRIEDVGWLQDARKAVLVVDKDRLGLCDMGNRRTAVISIGHFGILGESIGFGSDRIVAVFHGVPSNPADARSSTTRVVALGVKGDVVNQIDVRDDGARVIVSNRGMYAAVVFDDARALSKRSVKLYHVPTEKVVAEFRIDGVRNGEDTQHCVVMSEIEKGIILGTDYGQLFGQPVDSPMTDWWSYSPGSPITSIDTYECDGTVLAAVGRYDGGIEVFDLAEH